jgi:hypothetical protein
MKLESGLKEGPEDEAMEVHVRADHRDIAGARGWRFDHRCLSEAWDQQRNV